MTPMRSLMIPAIAVAATFPTLGSAQSPADLMRRYTVQVGCALEIPGGGIGFFDSGSGFVVGEGNVVVTNFHVIGHCPDRDGFRGFAAGRTPDSILATPDWVTADGDKDIAILRFNSRFAPTGATFSDSTQVRVQQPVYAVGYPGPGVTPNPSQRSLWEVKFSDGQIAAFDENANGRKIYTITAGVNPGNSGGPLFDECARVIGINTQKSLATVVRLLGGGRQDTTRVTRGDNIAWSIRAEEAMVMLQAQGVPVVTAPDLCPTATEQARTAIDEAMRAIEAAQAAADQARSLQAEQAAMEAAMASMTRQVAVMRSAFQEQLDSAQAALVAAQARQDSMEAASTEQQRRSTLLNLAAVLLAAVAVLVAFTKKGRRMVRDVATRGMHTITRVTRAAPPPGAAARGTPLLKGTAGEFAGTTIELNSEPIAIGRDPRLCQLVFALDNEEVSKRHCLVEYDTSKRAFTLEDCWSTNGTFLTTGARIESGQKQTLRSGEGFYLGSRNNAFEVRLER